MNAKFHPWKGEENCFWISFHDLEDLSEHHENLKEFVARKPRFRALSDLQKFAIFFDSRRSQPVACLKINSILKFYGVVFDNLSSFATSEFYVFRHY